MTIARRCVIQGLALAPIYAQSAIGSAQGIPARLAVDARVRDLWKRQDLGVIRDMLVARPPAHGSLLYRVSRG